VLTPQLPARSVSWEAAASGHNYQKPKVKICQQGATTLMGQRALQLAAEKSSKVELRADETI